MTRRSSNYIKNAARDLNNRMEDGASRVTSAVSGTIEGAAKAVKDAARKVAK